jgi:PKD repeat protein
MRGEIMKRPTRRGGPGVVLPVVFALFSAVVVAVGGVDSPATAVSPPSEPLPVCVTAGDGSTSGACPETSDDVSLSVSGVFTAGGTVTATLSPNISACDTWANRDVWAPVPCYDAVSSVSVVGCAYVSVVDDKFYETSCGSALYLDQRPLDLDLSSNYYMLGNEVTYPHPGCGGAGDFYTYVYGGDARFAEQKWINRGPTALQCFNEFVGERPDGLWGQTWVRLRAGIRVRTNEPDNSGGRLEYATTYVPIDGDLRDLGPAAGFEVDELPEAGTFRFRNTSVHPTGEAMTYSWDFGDGTTSTATSPEHTYESPGVYDVTLVADDGEDTDEATGAVTVEELFLWGMRDRFAPDDAGNLPFRWTAAEINPDTFVIEAVLAPALCEADLSLQIDGATLPITERDSCAMAFELPEGEFSVSVIRDGSSLGTVDVVVDDLLIVVIGDSVASGEGTGAPGEWLGPVEVCHRSADAAGALAAAEIEAGSAATSVTFVNLACSGASVAEGLLDYQLLSGGQQVDQLALMDQLISRKIDSLVMTAGANDVAFGEILAWCVLTDECEYTAVSYITARDQVDGGLSISGAISPTPYTTRLCASYAAGDDTLTIASQGRTPSVGEELMLRDSRGWTFWVNPTGWDYSPDRTDTSTGPSQGFSTERDTLNLRLPGVCNSALPVVDGIRVDVDPEAVSFSDGLSLFETQQVRARGTDNESTQPRSVEVSVSAPSLDTWVPIRLTDLRQNLDLLTDELRSPARPYDIGEMFIVEYPDELGDSSGETCEALLANDSLGVGVDVDEADWARSWFLAPLNEVVRATSGWNLVDGIESAFATRGYCAGANRWVNTLTDSQTQQGDAFGALHPNTQGQAFIATRIVQALRGELVATTPTPYEGYEPPPMEELADLSMAGQFRIDVPNTGFSLGDTIAIDPGMPNEETATVGGYGSLILTRPLQNTHPAGAEVRRVGGAATLQSFVDVADGRYFSDAVAWASAGGITTGTTPTQFSPDDDLTRAQLVTLLWRAMGEPTSTAAVPFTDIRAGSFYETAVRWAFENGITTGTSATTFSPDASGTRAQIATLLWRLAGSPSPTNSTSFSDIPSGRYFTQPVAWMLENGLTTGVGQGRWAPDQITSRAQGITFLYRLASANVLGTGL